MSRPTPRWNQRAFVALAAALSGLALPATGLADHVARDSQQSGDPVRAWAIGHTALGVTFIVFSVWHILLNRRALVRYLRRRLSGRVPSLEFAAALTLVGILVVLAVAHGMRE